MFKAHVVVAIAFLPALGCAQEQPERVIRTTVCELLRNPDAYNGKLVEVRARIAWSEEGSAIYATECAGLILFGADLKTEAKDRAQFQKLTRLLKKSHSVTALVSGRFEHATGRVWGHQAAFDSRLLTRSVSDFRQVSGER